MVVASIALFTSLGGVGYAATQIPDNSVGTHQLQAHAVTGGKIDLLAVGYRKIQFGAVGNRRINTKQVQVRVNGTCAAGGAIGAIDSSGKTTCNATLPPEFGTAGTVTVPSARTSVASIALPTGAFYLAFANPTASISDTSANQLVSVSCTLTVGTNTQTRSATVDTGPEGSQSAASIPLMIAGPAGTGTVSCQSSTTAKPLPTVSVTSAINAIQTSSNS